jgi:hypothetical protein
LEENVGGKRFRQAFQFSSNFNKIDIFGRDTLTLLEKLAKALKVKPKDLI